MESTLENSAVFMGPGRGCCERPREEEKKSHSGLHFKNLLNTKSSVGMKLDKMSPSQLYTYTKHVIPTQRA